MNPEQHSILRQTVTAYGDDFHRSLDIACNAMYKDIEAWRAVVEARFQAKLTQTFDMLNGPYNRDLVWDWVDDGQLSTELCDFIRERRVRLRDDPSFEISANEYFEKYARGNVSVFRVLQGE